MLYVASIGTHLPCWGSPQHRAAGDDEDAITQCVELFPHLRGEAVNQGDNGRIGLAHNLGGPAAVSAVTILEGPVAHGR